MDNNLIEILLKMFSPGFNQSSTFQNQSQNPAYQNYPFESFSQQNNSYQNNSYSQNNLLPLILSLLGNKSSPISEIFASKKEDENKKAEVSSASNDEILL